MTDTRILRTQEMDNSILQWESIGQSVDGVVKEYTTTKTRHGEAEIVTLVTDEGETVSLFLSAGLRTKFRHSANPIKEGHYVYVKYVGDTPTVNGVMKEFSVLVDTTENPLPA